MHWIYYLFKNPDKCASLPDEILNKQLLPGICQVSFALSLLHWICKKKILIYLLIDNSPLGLFWANETNYSNTPNILRIPTGRKQSSCLRTQHSQGVEPDTTWNKSSWWSKLYLNLGPQDFMSGILTIRPHFVHVCLSLKCHPALQCICVEHILR